MLPTRMQGEPVRVRKAALALLSEDRTRAWFAGLSVNVHYAADDAARCYAERCGHGRPHVAPDPHGRCGFHGSSDEPLGWMLPEAVLLDVELFGRVIRHERGWRAARQRVLGASFIRGCMDCNAPTDDPALVTVPAPVVSRRLLVGPRCRRCVEVWRWPGTGEPLAVAELAGLLGTEVSWADEETTLRVLRRGRRRGRPPRASAA